MSGEVYEKFRTPTSVDGFSAIQWNQPVITARQRARPTTEFPLALRFFVWVKKKKPPERVASVSYDDSPARDYAGVFELAPIFFLACRHSFFIDRTTIS